MIAKESIERVLDVCLIEILDKCNLQGFKKSGANYNAFSPFITEKSPSFMASKTKQVWKCFSSGKGGNGAVSFLMQRNNLSWIEAVEEVARIANIILVREEQTEEQKEQETRIEKERKVLLAAANKFKNNLAELNADHWSKAMLLHRGYQDLTLEQFMIGYATANSNELTSPMKEKGTLNLGVKVGLIKEAEGGRTYDYFNDRLMFPIQDDRGRVVSFGGRASNEKVAEKKTPKYLNGPETGLYKKDTILYGLFQSRTEIIKLNFAYITEGYTDVIACHDKGVQNVVATCGTSLSAEHVRKLRRLCGHIVILRDGDKAGRAAAYRDIDIILGAGIKVSVVELPEGEDPDTIAKRENEGFSLWLETRMHDALEWKASKLKAEASTADAISDSVTAIAESLMLINDKIKRKEYAKRCAKKLKVSGKDMAERLEELAQAKEKKRKLERRVYESKKAELITCGFPEDGDVEQFERDGYVIDPVQKCLYFEHEDWFFKGTNFIVNPLFVIRSAKGEGKRLIEFENRIGENTVFAINNKEISNYSQFKEKIVDGFNFTFEARVSNLHFTQFRNKLLYNFRSAYELYTLGQQPEGFFAFTNGVVYNNDFFAVDEYGIVDVPVQEADEENGKKEILETFYSPACSKINLSGRGEDDDAFEGVREFAYFPSEINFNQWMSLMYDVYGQKAMVGIAFVIAAIYRDIIVNQFSNFPHLFLTGQKQSGKTTFSESLTWLFTPKRKSFDLNTGTMVGFFRMVSRIKNIVVGLEEFTDQIHEAKFQTLKAAYDNRGRETGNVSGDKSTTVTKVQSACIILSQYLSTRDDNSLTSRSITLAFQEQNYTPEQKLKFSRLKGFERKGLTSVIIELLKHRKEVEASLSAVIEELNRDLVKSITSDYMERMLNNFISIMAPVKILQNRFAFPFSWNEFFTTCKDMIVASSDMISETEGTAKFWQVLEFLIDNKRIHEGADFIIEPKAAFSIMESRTKTTEYTNPKGDRILFLRLGKVHQDYVVEISRRKNEDPLGEATLRGYFKSKSYFIGSVKAMHFTNGSGSCYAFNYDMMEKTGIANLVREFKSASASFPDPNAFNPNVPVDAYANAQEDIGF